jgi:NADH dehydrogenase FAD-containing subunit
MSPTVVTPSTTTTDHHGHHAQVDVSDVQLPARSRRPPAASTEAGRPHRVVVLGAGYAGVLATNRLLSSLTPAEQTRVTVTVVNPRADFVERIRLHQVAAGTLATAARPLGDLLHPRANLLVAHAERIDPDARRVLITDNPARPAGDWLGYDTLVYAVGSTAATGTVPGAAAHAYGLADPDRAVAARAAVAALPAGRSVVVVGGGFTAIEAASELAEARPDLAVAMLTTGPVASGLTARARRRLLAGLDRLGVVVRTAARVTAVHPDHLDAATPDGSTVHLPADVCLWTASFAVPGLATRSGLPVDGHGRLRTDETLTVPGHPNIIGAGDAALAPPSVAGHLRMSCAAALPLGGHAAHTVLARLRNTTPEPLSVGFLVQCVSLGRRDGVIQLVHPDDRPRRVVLAGRVGARIKEQVCQLTVNGLLGERGKAGAYWAPRGPRPAVTRASAEGLTLEQQTQALVGFRMRG